MLTRVLALVDRPGTAELARDIRSGLIKVHWEELGPRLHGMERFGEIHLNPNRSVERLALTLVHEATHAEGSRRRAYPATEMEAFRAEAEFARRAGLEHLAPFTVEELRGLSDRQLRRLIVKRIPAYDGEVALYRSEAHWFVGAVGPEIVRGAARFGGAYLLAQALHALEAGDATALRDGARAVTSLGFWRDAAVFSGAAGVAGAFTPPNGLARMALPLAAGMAAVQWLHGDFSWRDFAVSTGAYLAAGAAVNLVADSLIYPLLFAAGPPGWIAAGLYTLAKTAVTLYLGDKILGWLGGREHAEASGGIRARIDALSR